MSRFVVLVLVGCSFGSSPPQTEGPSDGAGTTAEVSVDLAAFPDAPPLAVTTWVKGEPIDVATHDGLVLVEQWATWCGPCVQQIPHLTALQAAHGDRLTVIGVSDEGADKVAPFVARKGDEMAYTVALTTVEANGRWFDLAGNDGIPYAFLVQRGKVLWHGHPQGIDRVLPAVMDGSWTPEVAAEVQGLEALAEAYVQAATSGSEEAARLGARLAQSDWLSASTQNDVAWAILTEVPEERRDVDLALALSTKACEAEGRANWGYEDTLALAQFQKGLVEQAVATQEAAVRLCEEDGGGDACAELRDRLASFSAG